MSSFVLSGDYDDNVLTIKNYKLVIDWETVANKDTADANNDVSFTPSENLKEWKHTVEVKADVSYSGNAAAASDYMYTVSQASANGKPSSTTVKTYFAKGFFNLAKTSTSDSVLTVKLTNTSEKAVKIKGIIVDNSGALATASVNNQDVTMGAANTGSVNPQTVSTNSSIDIQLIAKKDSTVKLKGVIYEVEDEGTFAYELTSDITSVGQWWQFYSTKG